VWYALGVRYTSRKLRSFDGMVNDLLRGRVQSVVRRRSHPADGSAKRREHSLFEWVVCTRCLVWAHRPSVLLSSGLLPFQSIPEEMLVRHDYQPALHHLLRRLLQQRQAGSNVSPVWVHRRPHECASDSCTTKVELGSLPMGRVATGAWGEAAPDPGEREYVGAGRAHLEMYSLTAV
jgi:hypothetical protein